MNFAFDVALKNRALLFSFLETYNLEQLNTIPKGFKNNMFWNIAHTVVTQQLLVYGQSGLPTQVSESLIAKYKKGTKAEHEATQAEVDEIKTILFSTIEQTQSDYINKRFKSYTKYTVSTKSVLAKVEDAIAFNNFHEGIHLGYILALKKAV